MNVPLWYGTSGPRDAAIVLVGEAWGAEEDKAKSPFVGTSGQELTRMLRDAGINRDEILITNTTASRPPNNEYYHFFHEAKTAKKYGHVEIAGLHPNNNVMTEVARLYEQIHAHPRKLVIACGNYALWALTNHASFGTSVKSEGKRVPKGITTHRGSMYYMLHSRFLERGYSNIPLLPIIHPASILYQYTQRLITVQDLRARVPMALQSNWRPSPEPTFLAPPTYDESLDFFHEFLRKAEKEPTRLACDIETKRNRFISCVGFTDRKDFAICIPFMNRKEDGWYESYWKEKEEIEITKLMIKSLLHKNTLLEGQNFNYDRFYFFDHYNIIPRLDFDLMTAQHTVWPDFKKSLAFIASMYNDYYWYWKDDAAEDEDDKEEAKENVPLTKTWEYNCRDLWHTFNAATELRSLVKEEGQEEQFKFEMRKEEFALMMSLRGVPIDRNLRSKMGTSLMKSMNEIHNWLLKLVPQEWIETNSKVPWYNSPTQKKQVFSEVLNIKIPVSHKTKTETLGKDAMKELELKHPFWTGLFRALKLSASLGVFYNTFISVPLERDGRFRTFFKSAGPYTFRFASGKNPFGRGGNMQNIPKGDGDD